MCASAHSATASNPSSISNCLNTSQTYLAGIAMSTATAKKSCDHARYWYHTEKIRQACINTAEWFVANALCWNWEAGNGFVHHHWIYARTFCLFIIDCRILPTWSVHTKSSFVHRKDHDEWRKAYLFATSPPKRSPQLLHSCARLTVVERAISCIFKLTNVRIFQQRADARQEAIEKSRRMCKFCCGTRGHHCRQSRAMVPNGIFQKNEMVFQFKHAVCIPPPENVISFPSFSEWYAQECLNEHFTDKRNQATALNENCWRNQATAAKDGACGQTSSCKQSSRLQTLCYKRGRIETETHFRITARWCPQWTA